MGGFARSCSDDLREQGFENLFWWHAYLGCDGRGGKIVEVNLVAANLIIHAEGIENSRGIGLCWPALLHAIERTPTPSAETTVPARMVTVASASGSAICA